MHIMHASMRRGQAEFALILGIVIIAVIVAAFAFSSMQGPGMGQSSLTGEQKAVETYVLDAIDRSADQMLDYVYAQGGYVDTTDAAASGIRFVDYGGTKVAYWQVCDGVNIPKVEENLEEGMERLLKKTIPESTDIAGKQVLFGTGDARVDVKIYEEDVEFLVTLPTTIEGQVRTQPYEVEVRSKLGRILDFSTEFSYFQKRHRALDENLMKILTVSNPESPGECWLPTFGIMTERFQMTWPKAKECMHLLIDHTLTHTLFWEWPKVGDDGVVIEDVVHYAYIPQIQKMQETGGGWVQYPDLKVELSYGGDQELTRSMNEFYLMTDPDPLKINLIPVFHVKPYDVKYDISFPVVAKVRDDVLGKDFRFAAFVNIRDNVASKTEGCSIEERQPDEYENACQGGTVPVSITVNDFSGQPLPGVSVTFDGICELGETGGDGKLEGVTVNERVNSKIELYEPETASTQTICNVGSSDLSGMPAIMMPLREPFAMVVNIVEIDNPGGEFLRVRAIKGVTDADEKIEINAARNFGDCAEPLPNTYRNYHYETAGEGDETQVIEVGPYTTIRKDASENRIALEVTGDYDVSVNTAGRGIVTSNGISLVHGAFQKKLDGNIIYVYAPKIVSGGYDPEDSADYDARISALYSRCGISPLSPYPRSRYTNPGDAANYKIGCYNA